MVVGRTVAVGTTPTDLLGPLGVDGEKKVYLKFGSGQFWLGDSTVAINNGYTVNGPNAEFEMTTQAGDTVYAVAASGTPTVDMLVVSA